MSLLIDLSYFAMALRQLCKETGRRPLKALFLPQREVNGNRTDTFDSGKRFGVARRIDGDRKLAGKEGPCRNIGFKW